jgi:hypothetical protein
VQTRSLFDPHVLDAVERAQVARQLRDLADRYASGELGTMPVGAHTRTAQLRPAPGVTISVAHTCNGSC